MKIKSCTSKSSDRLQFSGRWYRLICLLKPIISLACFLCCYHSLQAHIQQLTKLPLCNLTTTDYYSKHLLKTTLQF